MVVQWGMSDLGPVSYSDNHDSVFLGRDLMQHHRYSQKTAMKIDREVKKIISRCYERTVHLLKTHNKILATLAEELIERETVDGAEVKRLVRMFSTEAATA